MRKFAVEKEISRSGKQCRRNLPMGSVSSMFLRAAFMLTDPKSAKYSQVISRKKADQLVDMLYFGGFALNTVQSSLIKLNPGFPMYMEERITSFVVTTFNDILLIIQVNSCHCRCKSRFFD